MRAQVSLLVVLAARFTPPLLCGILAIWLIVGTVPSTPIGDRLRGGNPNMQRGPATGVHCYDVCNDEGQPCTGCEQQADQEDLGTGSESLKADVQFKCGKVRTGTCVSVGNCNFTQTLQSDCSDITVIGPQ